MVIVVDKKVFYTFNLYDNIEVICGCGRRDRGRRGQDGGEDQGGQTSRMYHFGLNCLQQRYVLLLWWLFT